MIEIKRQISINAPVEKVWQVLAQEFDRVGIWASSIAQSKPNLEALAPNGAMQGGRVCIVPNFGELKETFTHYDQKQWTFSYEAIAGMPFFIKKAGNTWSLMAQGQTTVVNMHIIADVNFFPGKLMEPLMRRQFGRNGSEVIEELKHYIEHGTPHPRKLKAMKAAA
jgi:carbon monoxide dehydrogenase subunit G